MSECENFGKTTEEIIDAYGSLWIGNHCRYCPAEKACCLEATEKEHESGCNGEYELENAKVSDDSPLHSSDKTQTPAPSANGEEGE